MKVMRKMEIEVNKEVGFKVGDQIQIGQYYTATCQKVGKNGAIFMFDQYLKDTQVMNLSLKNISQTTRHTIISNEFMCLI